MISINSSNNFSAVLKNNFRRYAALFIVFQIFAVLFSGFLISFYADSYDGSYNSTNNITNTFSDICMPLFAFFCSIEAFILVAVMFRGIYSKRASDFYFSLPVKRGAWFNADFLFGVISFAVSYAIFCISSIIVINSNMLRQFRFINLEAGCFLKYAFMSFTALIVVYTVFVMCAVIAGRMWQYILLSFISSLALYAGAAGFICYLNTVYGFWLNLENSYIAAAVSLAFSGISDFSVLKFFLAAAVQFAVFYVVGYLSFKKRKAEVAENKLSGKLLPIVLTVTCFLAEIFVCLGIGNEVAFSGRIIAAIIMVSVTALILSAVFFRKAFSKPVFISLLGAVILSALTIFSVQLIPEKIYVNVAPEADEIEAVSIYDYNALGSSDITDLLYGINYLNISDESEVRNYKFLTDEAKEKAVELHKKLLSEKTRNNSNGFDEGGDTTLGIEYRLKNGRTIRRVYTVLTKDIIEEGIALFKTDEGINGIEGFDYNSEDIIFSVFGLYADDYENSFYIEKTDCRKLRECVQKDIMNREASEFAGLAGLPFLTMWEDYDSDLDNEPEKDIYTLSFFIFKAGVPVSERVKMEKLSPKEIVKYDSEFYLQIEEVSFYIDMDQDINTVSYLEELGYNFNIR
ncbi:MAG: hypothetical protein HFJ98_01905 [Eubacterium sp.]|nr:hypothetical protein [Eubacterium sp.]